VDTIPDAIVKVFHGGPVKAPRSRGQRRVAAKT